MTEEMKVLGKYLLAPEEAAKMAEWFSIERSARVRLNALQQKIQDCKRLRDGFMTEVKWREGWQDGDGVVYDPVEGLICRVEFLGE